MPLPNKKFFVHIVFVICSEDADCTTLIVQQGNLFSGTVAGVTAGAVVVPELVVGALNCVGFTAVGPAAGSIAAAIQSSIGCVAAGSPFAIAQSLAMGGMAGPLSAAGAVIGGTAVAISVLARNIPGDDEHNPDSDEDDDGHDGDGGEEPK